MKIPIGKAGWTKWSYNSKIKLVLVLVKHKLILIKHKLNLKRIKLQVILIVINSRYEMPVRSKHETLAFLIDERERIEILARIEIFEMVQNDLDQNDLDHNLFISNLWATTRINSNAVTNLVEGKRDDIIGYKKKKIQTIWRQLQGNLIHYNRGS